MTLVLGTVQLGMPYGIANTQGQPDQAAATRIVSAALAGGIVLFDTAQGYGESETVLGRALAACSATNVEVVSKLSPSLAEDDAPFLENSVRDSLKRLDVPTLTCLMLHREEHLRLLDGALGAALSAIRDKGLAARLGVSVYTPEAALSALRHPLLSVVQIPTSLFDRRFLNSGVMRVAREMGKELHIRSALLQGVLCMEPADLPACLDPLAPALAAFRAACARFGASPAGAALGWAARACPDAGILFGAETVEQVQENLDFQAQRHTLLPALWEELDGIVPPQLPELLNPSLWKR
ncbi:NADP-dependent oxidoreductase domain containing protein [Desulfovibrio sp. X2]|uniref:aldo/keto reductase n=1 Tax=Desulfovibrio sp. X2 TaxID=941449 RepID=UPI0003586FAC|nr:aldo/keto reductase [Desulfovibrio sp. X2]EPR37160.1 NADP-dependent oxidoreductase domain containing protein [Desulfovibrio sp. X2]